MGSGGHSTFNKHQLLLPEENTLGRSVFIFLNTFRSCFFSLSYKHTLVFKNLGNAAKSRYYQSEWVKITV